MKYFKSKCSQTEVITTVLLVLLSIAAVVLVSSFVMRFVKESMNGKEICFDATAQIKINSGVDLSFYDSTKFELRINIERDSGDFNLTGFNLAFGTDWNTKKITIKKGLNNNVEYILPDAIGTRSGQVQLPDAGETKTYVIDVSAYGMETISKVSVSPIVYNPNTFKDVQCEKADEAVIKTI